MNKKLFALTILSALLSLSAAQVFSQGSCPENVKVVEDFSVDKYLGKWYEYAKYPTYFEDSGKCISANYSLNNFGGLNVLNSMINMYTNEPNDILGDAKVIDNAKLLVQFPISPVITVSSNYWILDTDYDNYAVVYSCTPMPGAHSTIAWILTRQPFPEAATIEKALAALNNNNISLNDFKMTNQISCNREIA